MNRPAQSFGAPATDLKLRKLADYLIRYNTALQFKPSRDRPFRKVYFDAFAGNGGIGVQGESMPLFNVVESSTFIEGSARRALALTIPFDEYIFVEKSPERARELRKIVSQEYPHLEHRVRIQEGDANVVLAEFCRSTNWHSKHSRQTRAVVFLDPFGNAVDFDTVKAIAATEAIDLWYLFPAGWGVNRQIRTRDGDVHHTHEATLDRLYGYGGWRQEIRRETGQLSLLPDSPRDYEKVATPVSMTELMIERMKQPFGGRVLDDWLPLGAKGRHDYSLIFAWANPSEKAKLAAKIAAAVLRSKKNGRPK